MVAADRPRGGECAIAALMLVLILGAGRWLA
jgi:hypothetical protein